MKKSEEIKVKGIRVRILNGIIIGVILILCCFTFFTSQEFSKRYEHYQKVTESYITSSEAISSFFQASNYLTEMTGYFVNNMDSKFLFMYFDEIDSQKNRDKAIDALKQCMLDEYIVKNFETALIESNELSKYEIYAMKLITETSAYKKSGQKVPDELYEVVLTDEDLALSDSAKIERARELTFGTGYYDLKSMILSHSRMSVYNLQKASEAVQVDNNFRFRKILNTEKFMLIMIFLLNLISYIALVLLLVVPLKKVVATIGEGKPLETCGAYEFRFLVAIYNKLLAKNRANEGILKYEAEHDGLTGLINRGAFARISSALGFSVDHVAMILIDVDKFKEINDKCGHTAGDEVLKHVADLLSDSFRSTDYVARVGGDEFAVIMTNYGDNVVELLSKKFTEINHDLFQGKTNCPPATLSIGTALSNSGYSKELYEKADKALYAVKERGRNGFEFYENLKSE